jgi:hypothetical protein
VPAGLTQQLKPWDRSTASFLQQVRTPALVQYLERRGLKGFHLGHERVAQALLCGMLLEAVAAGQPEALARWQRLTAEQQRGVRAAIDSLPAEIKWLDSARRKLRQQHTRKTGSVRVTYTRHAIGVDVVQKAVAPQLLQPGSPVPPECQEALAELAAIKLSTEERPGVERLRHLVSSSRSCAVARGVAGA